MNLLVQAVIMAVLLMLLLPASGIWKLPATVLAAEKAKESVPEVQVTVVRATQAWFAAEVHVTGYLVAREEAIVNLDMPGYKLSEVLVGEGDRVNSGQTVARATRQPADGVDPAADRRPATINLKAPTAGIITRSSAVVGAVASMMPTEPLFRLATDNEIELEAEVPSLHVPMLAPGQSARIEIENRRELTGKVRLVPAAVDPRMQVGRARVSIERDPRLRIGIFARATIEADRSRGVSIPNSAVQYATEGPTVQLVIENRIKTQVVRVGFHSDNDIEIREGVREGDLVVANGGSSLRDGATVKPVVADSTQSVVQ
jgi:HlyD family secretion protein